jgi:hypothetical protein
LRLQTLHILTQTHPPPHPKQSLHDKHESWLHFGARPLDAYVAERRAAAAAATLQTTARLRHAGSGAAGLAAASPRLAGAARGGGLRWRADAELLAAAPAAIRDNIVFLGGAGADGEGGGGGAGGGDAERRARAERAAQAEPRDALVGPGGAPLNNRARGGGAVLTALDGVPALVLDHEPDDILHDRDARAEYASKVRLFSEYVKSIAPPGGALELAPHVGAAEAAARENAALRREVAELTARLEGGARALAGRR